eukprot:scaffold70817_cov19-Tisochrysis_lutea.AAC.2
MARHASLYDEQGALLSRHSFGMSFSASGAHECIGGHTSGQQAAPEIWILPQEAEHVGSL